MTIDSLALDKTLEADPIPEAVNTVLSIAIKSPIAWRILGNWYIGGAIGTIDPADLLANPNIVQQNNRLSTLGEIRTALREEVANPTNGLNRIEANTNLDPFERPMNRSPFSWPLIDGFIIKLQAGLNHLTPTLPRVVALGDAVLVVDPEQSFSSDAEDEALSNALAVLRTVVDHKRLEELKVELAANDRTLHFGTGGVRLMTAQKIKEAMPLDLYGFGRGAEAIKKNKKIVVRAGQGYVPPAPLKTKVTSSLPVVRKSGRRGRDLAGHPLFADKQHEALLAACKTRHIDTLATFVTAFVETGVTVNNARFKIRQFLNGNIYDRRTGRLSTVSMFAITILQQPAEILFPEYQPPAIVADISTETTQIPKAEKKRKAPITPGEDFAGLLAAYPAIYDTVTANYKNRAQIAAALIATGSTKKGATRHANNLGSGKLITPRGTPNPSLLAIAKLVPIELRLFASPEREKKQRKARVKIVKASMTPEEDFADLLAAYPTIYEAVTVNYKNRTQIAAALIATGSTKKGATRHANDLGNGKLIKPRGTPNPSLLAIAKLVPIELGLFALPEREKKQRKAKPVKIPNVPTTTKSARLKKLLQLKQLRPERHSITRIPSLGNLFNCLIEPLQANGVTHIEDIKAKTKQAGLDPKDRKLILSQIRSGTFIGMAGRPTAGLRFLAELANWEVPETLVTVLPGRSLKPLLAQNLAS